MSTPLTPLRIELAWNKDGLIPAMVVHADNAEPLMLAWMNADALKRTFASGIVHFYSRSRQALWKKGETSGNTLELVELRTDCDADTLWVRARPAGPACHTGRRSCFYRLGSGTDEDKLVIEREDEGPGGQGATILDELYEILEARRDSSSAEKSYTKSLLEGGADKINRKLEEECGELMEVLAVGKEDKVIHESADLIFHLMVGLCSRGIEPQRVWDEFGRRFGTSGHEEKASRSKS